MEGERLLRYPADHQNAVELVTFLNNAKACAEWLLKSGAVIQRNEALLATIGKADEIEKLHADAAALKGTVLAAIETREAALAEDRKAFTEERAKRNTTFTEKQARDSEKFSEKTRKLDAALATATAQESAAKEANAAATAEQQRATDARVKVTELQAELKEQVERGRQLMNPKAA